MVSIKNCRDARILDSTYLNSIKLFFRTRVEYSILLAVHHHTNYSYAIKLSDQMKYSNVIELLDFLSRSAGALRRQVYKKPKGATRATYTLK